MIYNQLYKIIRQAQIFDFCSGKDFKNNHLDFPTNGIYLMFEKNQISDNGARIVRIGINLTSPLMERLNRHINGTIRNSIFRRHLFRILGSEEKVSKYIKNNITFCIISDSANRRQEVEKKLIGTVSSQNNVHFSNKWLGSQSDTKRIKDSGLWNVHYVFGENKLDQDDLKYIKDNLY